MGAVAAVVVALVALILAPGFSFWFDVTPKTVMLFAGTACLAVLACRRAPAGEEVTPAASGLQRVFGALVLAGALSLALSTALSTWPALSLYGGTWRQFGAIAQTAVLGFAWLVMRIVSTQSNQARILLRGVAFAGAVAGAYGIAQYAGWDPLLPRAGYHIGEGVWTIVRPPGTLGYVSYFATWLLMAGFLSLLLLQVENSRRAKFCAGAAAVACAVGVVLSGTRAAWLGAAVGAAVWMWAAGWRPGRRTAIYSAALAALGFAFYFSAAGWNLRSRARWYAEDPWGGARLLLWRESLGMSLHRPLAGFGPEVFPAAFPQYESARLAAAYPDFAHESPHNILLDALVAQGVPGLLVLLGFAVLAAVAVVRLRRANRLAAAALGAALAAGMISQQFTAFTMPTALLWFTALALAVAWRGGFPRAPHRLRAAILLPAACLLLIVAFRLAVSDHQLARTRDALAQRRWADATTAFERYRSVRLPGVSADLWYSRTVLAGISREPDPVGRLRAFGEGLAAAQRATSASDEPFNAWYNAAAYESARNDAAATERCLRQAIRAHPNWFKPHWALARLLQLLSRRDEAESEAARSVELDGAKHPELIKTLQEIHESRSAVLQ